MNVKFLIVGAPRTGSTLLVKTLNSLAGVCCHGELLQEALVRGYEDGFTPLTASKSERDERSRRLLQQRDQDPLAFIQETLSATNKATGFKVLYREFLLPRWAGVIESLLTPDIKFIHLTRKNSLRRYISEQVSAAGGAIHSLPGGRSDKKIDVHIDINTFLSRSAVIEAHTHELSSRLSGHDVIDISYEDLSSDTAATVFRVCQFLGLDIQQADISPALKKVGSADLRDTVINYQELIENEVTRELVLQD